MVRVGVVGRRWAGHQTPTPGLKEMLTSDRDTCRHPGGASVLWSRRLTAARSYEVTLALVNDICTPAIILRKELPDAHTSFQPASKTS